MTKPPADAAGRRAASSAAAPFAGLLAGVGQVLAEQPLDTLKTRLQSAHFGASDGAFRLAVTTVRGEGGGALLLGVVPRIATYPLVKLSLFSLFEAFYAQTQSFALAGACAGALNTVVSCPADVVKSQLQVQRRKDPSLAAVRVVSSLVKTHGAGVLYRGLAPLAARDTLGYAILYTVYYRGQELQRRSDAAAAAPRWAIGGAAGACFYGATLPIDRVKVLQQTQAGGAALGLGECLATVRRGGLAAFYRGAGPTFARTFVGQAVGLSVYDLVRGWQPTYCD
ncbi:hypothetical protein EMIHUDRAFT_112617 [Emiliania huxleyi CCMP1516]|uniref:Mitochondrial carrier protein n=2 Tax=Emiliania huxleyi TaxID=2903 RepID=A0A0D3K7R7_EMIH1|nr:hypothetical protein EMIHUDRAFT_112617 [Emiliania huxleyi CCMP1516]EOD31802.1 hypothetical protein EMIHUDRAFT_112617 [Emiliania huxleyi CCMP1516]|eukprot:XP_005784231.1 hypothetical protein EMIHUDRAFT_112617 [Emiliania huxleyi CCMP1516]